jgi:threonine dehydrogenase-like Zn-dependent dehydrogenase
MTWILSFSDDLPWKENFRFHARRLEPVARILGEHGCRLGLEFLGPKTLREGHRYSFIHTMEQMLDLCDAVGPNCGLLLDAWHWYTSLGTVEELLNLDNQQVVYVHINDAPAGIPMEQHLDNNRRLPGETGVIDLAGFLGALRHIGYDGPVVPEPFVPALKELAPAEAAARVGKALDHVWNLPSPISPSPAASRARKPKKGEAEPTARVSKPLPETMKAIAVGGGKAWIVELPVPRPEGNQVIVKLSASPICGSNLGSFLREGESVNGGHEGAGEVVATAESCLLKPGDRVALAPLGGCGVCEYCRSGDGIFCRNRPTFHGNFAQYTKICDSFCTVLPDDIDYDLGSLLGCCLGPAFRAMTKLEVSGSDTVVIAGLGPVGLGAVALSVFLGARAVGLDPVAYRRERAEELGARITLDPTREDIRDALMEATAGRGVLKAVDCSGKETSERLLIDLAAINGRIAMAGENAGTIPISPSNDFIRKGLSLYGCWHMNVLEAPRLFPFLQDHREAAERLISHRFGFGDAQEAFDIFAGKNSAKVVLEPWG